MAEPEEQSGKMSVADAGRKGGQATREKYGIEHYSKISARGVASRRARGSLQGQVAAGHKAGATTLARHGREHYQRMAKASAVARTKPSIVDATEEGADDPTPNQGRDTD